MHTHYKGTGKVHSFRGLLEDGGQNEINIEGSVGAVAWRITKFEGISEKPAAVDQESVIKIFREEQSSLDAEINFNEGELLGVVSFVELSATSSSGPTNIIFDNALFVRNIWVSHKDGSTGESANYYIELEEVTVSAAGKAQLAVAAARRTLN